MQLRGKRTLVTGSSSGIGLGVGKAFAEAGAEVVLSSEKPRGDISEAEQVLLRPGTHYLQANLLQDGEPQRLVRNAWQKLGGIDVLVNNAGTYREPPLLDIRKEHFDLIFNLNVWAPMAASIEFARLAQEAKRGGTIIFTTSLNGSRSEPAHVLYDPSKGAINALTRQLAIELAPAGINVVAVAPGLVETPITDFGLRSDPTARKAIEEQIPLRRISVVDDLAPWYVFLASDAARYATGSIFTVDGGLDAQQMPSRPIGEGERR